MSFGKWRSFCLGLDVLTQFSNRYGIQYALQFDVESRVIWAAGIKQRPNTIKPE